MERRRNKRENQLHFFEECGFRIGESDRFRPSHCGTRVEEIYSKIRVVTFDTLADVLNGGDVERHRDSVHGQNDRFIFTILTDRKTINGTVLAQKLTSK